MTDPDDFGGLLRRAGDLDSPDTSNPKNKKSAEEEMADLKLDSEREQEKVRGSIREIIGKLIRWALHLAFFIAMIVTLIFVWHLIAPECLRWLSPTDLDKIQDNVGSLSLGAIIGFLVHNKYL